MDGQQICVAYHELYQVERSFRMTKSDLVARPIFHRIRDSIEAHLTIVFAALAVSREAQARTGLSTKKIVQTLRPLRSATINLGSRQITAQPRIPDHAQTILDDLAQVSLNRYNSGQIAPVPHGLGNDIGVADVGLGLTAIGGGHLVGGSAGHVHHLLTVRCQQRQQQPGLGSGDIDCPDHQLGPSENGTDRLQDRALIVDDLRRPRSSARLVDQHTQWWPFRHRHPPNHAQSVVALRRSHFTTKSFPGQTLPGVPYGRPSQAVSQPEALPRCRERPRVFVALVTLMGNDLQPPLDSGPDDGRSA